MLDQPTILFGHPAYRLGDAYRKRAPAAPFTEVRTLQAVADRIAEVDILVVSRLWQNEWVEKADRLRFIQSVSAGTEQFDVDRLRRRGIRLASAQGANATAVAEHAFGLILSLSRLLHRARDYQRERRWRGLISDPNVREFELSGSTMVVIGLGQIGRRVAALAKAFGMRVIGLRRAPGAPDASVNAVRGRDDLLASLAEADVVVLTCPHTPETEGLIGTEALAAMRPSALLINVARGRVVDEDALICALQNGIISGAGLDCFREEPLPDSSPLWGFDNVLITSHNAGETRRYEESVIDVLMENLARLRRGETELRNQVV